MDRVLITGASSGLGSGFVQILQETGHEIYCCSRRDLPAELQSHELIHHRKIDLEQLDQINQEIAEWFQGETAWDRVILNAGLLGQIADLSDTPLSEIRSVMDVNVWANKLLLDALFKQGHKIKSVIAISSGASVNGHRGWSTYSISKAALNMLIRLYAAERPETHFISLAPGLIDTAMQDYMYIRPDVNKFPSVQRLRDARYTENMPRPADAARKIINALPVMDHIQSGSFVDIRKI